MTGKRIAAAAVLLALMAAAVLVGCLKPLHAAYRAYEVSFGEEAQEIMDELRAKSGDLLAVCGGDAVQGDAAHVDAAQVDALRQAISAYDRASAPSGRKEACLAMVAAAQGMNGDSALIPLLVSELDRLAALLADTPNTAAAAAEFNRLRSAIPARWFCTLFGIGEI